jgi:hypothetical protein
MEEMRYLHVALPAHHSQPGEAPGADHNAPSQTDQV